MKVAVIQSNYLPWRGYFDFISSVDVFVFYDDVQYSKGDWRNRNKIKTQSGLHWITVPVHHCCLSQLISETTIDYSKSWQSHHRKVIMANYARAPFATDVDKILEPVFALQYRTISELNVALIRAVCSYLGITTSMRYSQEFNLKGRKTQRLIELLTELGAKTYVSGPSAKSYLDESLFCEAGIGLEYKSYDYPEYPQLWGAFDGAVSVIDLIANCGTTSKNFIRSRLPNEVAIP